MANPLDSKTDEEIIEIYMKLDVGDLEEMLCQEKSYLRRTLLRKVIRDKSKMKFSAASPDSKKEIVVPAKTNTEKHPVFSNASSEKTDIRSSDDTQIKIQQLKAELQSSTDLNKRRELRKDIQELENLLKISATMSNVDETDKGKSAISRNIKDKSVIKEPNSELKNGYEKEISSKDIKIDNKSQFDPPKENVPEIFTKAPDKPNLIKENDISYNKKNFSEVLAKPPEKPISIKADVSSTKKNVPDISIKTSEKQNPIMEKAVSSTNIIEPNIPNKSPVNQTSNKPSRPLKQSATFHVASKPMKESKMMPTEFISVNEKQIVTFSCKPSKRVNTTTKVTWYFNHKNISEYAISNFPNLRITKNSEKIELQFSNANKLKHSGCYMVTIEDEDNDIQYKFELKIESQEEGTKSQLSDSQSLSQIQKGNIESMKTKTPLSDEFNKPTPSKTNVSRVSSMREMFEKKSPSDPALKIGPMKEIKEATENNSGKWVQTTAAEARSLRRTNLPGNTTAMTDKIQSKNDLKDTKSEIKDEEKLTNTPIIKTQKTSVPHSNIVSPNQIQTKSLQKHEMEEDEIEKLANEALSKLTKTPNTFASTNVPSGKTYTKDEKSSVQLNVPQMPIRKTSQPAHQSVYIASAPGVRRRSASTVTDLVLQWAKLSTQNYQNVNITNFSGSWADGLAFCALIHHFYPESFDYSKLTSINAKENFQLAFDTAKNYAGIEPLLEPEDMLALDTPDWKSVYTYVQYMFKILKSHPNNLLKAPVET